jgi:SAM-dependent methyltransferase
MFSKQSKEPFPWKARFEDADNFPGYDKAPQFIRDAIGRTGAKHIADIGGGANPMVDWEFIAENDLSYRILDISAEELAKAPATYAKTVVDLCAPPDQFDAVVEPSSFDLTFTHMFLEHVQNPELVHRNIRSMLRPGGIALHFVPCSSNFPLTVNRLMPEWITKPLVRIAQPNRDISGHQVKFPAYYKLCGAPSKRLADKYRAMGFEIIRYDGYVGHSYYDAFPPLRAFERGLRRLLIALQIPMASQALLVLKRV